jgi:4-amino-4-deoxy-L-arabinose transferase-like glycosyltransferase/Flp pilus assembly protein TadD
LAKRSKAKTQEIDEIPRRTLLAVFALAFLIRVLYIQQYRSSLFFDYPIIDNATYDRMAWDYVQGKPLWKGAFWQPPLYPWLLGVLYWVIGHSLLGVRLVQAVVGALSCLVLYGIGRKSFSHQVGTVAACVMAVYGPLIYFDGELLPTSLYLFLLLCGLLVLVHAANWKGARAWVLWLGAGLVLGLAALTRSDVALFISFTTAWGICVMRDSLRKQLVYPALFVVGTGLVVLPVAIRNYRASHDIVLISSNAGVNFYLGNNPEADKTVAIRPGFAWESLVNEPYLKAGLEKPSARSRYFFRKGLAFLHDHPKKALRLYANKFSRLWNSFEIGRNRDVYSTRDDSQLLSMLLWRKGDFGFPFGLLAPLGCAGLVMCFSFDRRRLLLYLFVVAYTVAVVLFFVASRYRIAIVPVLILFAAQYAFWVLDHVRHRSFRPLILSFIPLVLVCVGVNRGFPAVDLIYRGETDRYLGAYYVDNGQYNEAEEAYQRAIVANPDYAEAHAELGQVYQAQGRHAEAMSHLKKANELCPFSEQTHYLLGTAYADLGDSTEAEKCFRKAITIAPHARAARDLGVLLLQKGQLKEAEQLLLQALRTEDDLDSWYKLGQCYFLLGDYEKAENALRGALRLAPNDSEIIEKIKGLRALQASLQAHD